MQNKTKQKISNLIIWLAIGTLIGSIIWFWPWYLLGANLLLITLAIYFIPDEYSDEEELTHNQLEQIFERDGGLTSGRLDNITQLKDFIGSVIIPEGSVVNVVLFGDSENKINEQFNCSENELLYSWKQVQPDSIISSVQQRLNFIYDNNPFKAVWMNATIYHPNSQRTALK